MYAIRFIKTKKSDLCDESEIEEQIGTDLCSKIIEKKGKCILDQNKRNFDEMCFDLNEILVGQKLFLRVYKLKDKFRYLFHEDYKKKEYLEAYLSVLKKNLMGLPLHILSLQKKKKMI